MNHMGNEYVCPVPLPDFDAYLRRCSIAVAEAKEEECQQKESDVKDEREEGEKKEEKAKKASGIIRKISSRVSKAMAEKFRSKYRQAVRQ